MEWIIHESLQLANADITLQGAYLGKDFFIVLSGGDQKHIGCVVQSFPRPSLEEEQKTSVTSSVLNVIGHKDEYICRYVSENFCKALETIVVCTGGIHVEEATAEDIQKIVNGIKKWIPEVIDKMKRV